MNHDRTGYMGRVTFREPVHSRWTPGAMVTALSLRLEDVVYVREGLAS